MPNLQIQDPDFENRVRDSFGRQVAMSSLGISISMIAPGRIELQMPFLSEFTQQHGFTHAGIITTGLDSACGYAAFSLMPSDAAVLTVELKTSLLAPAKGERYRLVGQVVKPGRTLTFCEGKAYAIDHDHETLVSTMSATMMTVQHRDNIQG